MKIRSTDDFISILRTTNAYRLLASFYVESLFTNVPIETTIDILQNVYDHENLPPLKLPPKILAELLRSYRNLRNTCK